MLKHVETVIVDEIHAVADDKRGAHLSLSLERLEHLTQQKLVQDRTFGNTKADRRSCTIPLRRGPTWIL